LSLQAPPSLPGCPSALRTGSSTGALHHVLLRGIDRRPLVFVLGISSQVISATARKLAEQKKLV